MIDHIIAQTVSLGNYIAIWKIIIFLVLFGVWAWVGQWLDKDAPITRTNRTFWNNVYLGLGAVSVLLWVMLPAPFIVGMLLFMAVWLTVTVAYVVQRNARVAPNERILTPDHIKQVFSRQGKKEIEYRLALISANKNVLPVPDRQETEYDGYVGAEELLYDMYWRRVSLADMQPVGENFQMRYVIDGVTGNAGERPRAEVEPTISYLKAVADLEVKELRRPQNGQFSIQIDNKVIDFRICTSGSTRGEQMRIELLQESQEMAIDILGFNTGQLEPLQELIAKPEGIILVCGSRGSGVSTTLYSIIRSHDAFIQNINTLERKTLTDLDNITQNVIEKQATGEAINGGRQLQSVLRSDPDTIMVGFCDDPEMARLGTKAARDGKKLYYAMEVPSTFHGLQQWLTMVQNNKRVIETLHAITCQKLLRRLCTECREAYTPDPVLLKRLNLPVEKIKRFFRPPVEPEYDKRGNPIICPNCQGTGYVGRTAVFELLILTDGLKELIVENAPVNAIRTQCRKDKMLYLQEQAIRKVIEGITSIQEVLRVTVEKSGKPAVKKSAAPPKTTK